LKKSKLREKLRDDKKGVTKKERNSLGGEEGREE